MEHKFFLGARLKDLVTGFIGIAVSRIEYLNGCIQYGVKSAIDEKGNMPEVQYIDQQQLVFVNDGVSVAIKDGGGEMPDAPKH